MKQNELLWFPCLKSLWSPAPYPLSRVVGSAGPNGPLWIRSGTIVRSSHGIVSLTASPALTQGCPTLTHFIHRNIFCDWTLKDFNLWLIPSQHRARQHCYKAEPLLCVPKLDISDGHIEKDMVFLMHDSSCAAIPHGCHQNILWLLATNNKGWFDYSALTPPARTSQVLNMRTWQILKSNGQYSLQISTKPLLLSLTTGCHTTHFQNICLVPVFGAQDEIQIDVILNHSKYYNEKVPRRYWWYDTFIVRL